MAFLWPAVYGSPCCIMIILHLITVPSIYAVCFLLGASANATIPLFYELSCEASYPVAEGVTGGFYTLVMNLFGLVFLFIKGRCGVLTIITVYVIFISDWFCNFRNSVRNSTKRTFSYF